MADVFAEGIADAVTLGRAFLANPDLITRIRAQGPYNTPEPASYYGGDGRGYTDYPALTPPACRLTGGPPQPDAPGGSLPGTRRALW